MKVDLNIIFSNERDTKIPLAFPVFSHSQFSHKFTRKTITCLNYLMCVSVGIGPVHMNEVECSGFEKSLTECHFNRESLSCSHEEDAAVRCNVPAMGFNTRVSVAFGHGQKM